MATYQIYSNLYKHATSNGTWTYPHVSTTDSYHKYLPALFFHPYERSFTPLPLLLFTRNHDYIATVVIILYLLFIYYGPKWMQSRPAYDLKKPLKYWNMFLAIISFMGTIRVVPQLLYLGNKYGFSNTVCIPPIWSFGYEAAGFWTTFFVYSKFIELIDTVFLVLRKRPVSFLHWYHHSTVLMFTWRAYIREQPVGTIFCSINYAVHALMYYYYYLSSTNEKRPKWGIVITFLQILQMFVGLAITVTAMIFSFKYPALTQVQSSYAYTPLSIPTCQVTRQCLVEAMLMYSTYCYLFSKYFVDRHFKMKRASSTILKKDN